MKIIRKDELKVQLFDEIRKNMEKDRDYITLYDMLYPRKCFWQKTKPLPLTDDEIMYFTTGKGHEEMLRYVSGYKKGDLKLYNALGYRMDVFGKHPIEVKTRRGFLPKEENVADVYDGYIRQILQYCAVENSNLGYLWVWALTGKDDENKTKPDLVTYELKFTDDELSESRRIIDLTYDLLKLALNEGDFRTLPLCPEWMCYSVRKDMTKKPYCLTCKREFLTDWGMKKHTESKGGKEHSFISAVYEASFEARCKWWEDCQRKQ